MIEFKIEKKNSEGTLALTSIKRHVPFEWIHPNERIKTHLKFLCPRLDFTGLTTDCIGIITKILEITKDC